MRIIAIDASVRHGVVSRSVNQAASAARDAGAKVTLIRLADLDIRYCTNCGMCRLHGTCKIDDDLPRLVEQIADADGVIFGTPSYFRRPNDVTMAVMDRISSYFSDPGQLRLPGMDKVRSATSRQVKRAVIITACRVPEPLATFFGYTTGPVRELRSALSVGGIRTIGSLAVTDGWRQAAGESWEKERAESLGRIVAGKI